MEHLIECGCKKVVCIKGVQTIASANARYRGYQDVCKERGIEERTVDCDYNFINGLRAAEELIEKYPDVDGIIATNDMVAISVYKVLKKNHMSVPDQVQLVGYDDVEIASIMTPELTTIRQGVKTIGKKAAELIIFDSNKETDENNYILPVQLIERETTKRKV